jgi:hypothetical protein
LTNLRRCAVSPSPMGMSGSQSKITFSNFDLPTLLQTQR